MKVYLVIEYDYDTGPELRVDSVSGPKAFLNRPDAEIFTRKNEHREIFEYEIEDYSKQLLEDNYKLMEFRRFVANLECTKADSVVRRFGHAITGIGMEAGELLTEMKKTVFYNIYNGEINVEKVGDESCDLLHYLVMLTNILDISFDRLIELNIVKLKERFPNGFSQEAWLNRDKGKEREAMEKVEQRKGRIDDKEEGSKDKKEN